MQYQFIEQVDAKEHDAFVSKHKLCNLLQSSSWGLVKENWKHTIVGVKYQNQLVASCMILIKPLPLGFSMFYIPRGPVLDFSNTALVAFLMKELKRYARKYLRDSQSILMIPFSRVIMPMFTPVMTLMLPCPKAVGKHYRRFRRK